MSFGKSSSSTKSSTTPTFNLPEARSLLSGLSGAFSNAGSERGTVVDFLKGQMGRDPSEISPFITNLTDSIRAEADHVLPREIAQMRSRFYRRPIGVNDKAVADTIAGNRIQRDKLVSGILGDQFNLNRQFQTNAAGNLQNLNQGELGQALSLLQLLRGEDSRSKTQSKKSGLNVASMLAAAGGIMTSNPALIAAAVGSADN